jgi:two-component system OmpR family response regulator
MTALRVLHIDDEPDIREVVALSLSLDSNFATRSCSSGEEALVVAAAWQPQIILLDVMMPGMDGPTTLARMREKAATATIPVVFMTARAQTRELDYFRSLGAVGVIPKPFDPMTLASVLRTHIKPEEDQLGGLRSVFLQRVSDDARALAKLGGAFKSNAISPLALTGIRQLAHGLSGASGIFGFPDISDAAAALEEAVIEHEDGSGSVQAIARALDQLLASIETNRILQEPLRSLHVA